MMERYSIIRSLAIAGMGLTCGLLFGRNQQLQAELATKRTGLASMEAQQNHLFNTNSPVYRMVLSQYATPTRPALVPIKDLGLLASKILGDSDNSCVLVSRGVSLDNFRVAFEPTHPRTSTTFIYFNDDKVREELKSKQTVGR